MKNEKLPKLADPAYEISAREAWRLFGIMAEFVDGTEMNSMAVVRDGEVTHLTLSDRHRPPGPGFAVGWIHAYPAQLNGNGTAAAEAPN